MSYKFGDLLKIKYYFGPVLFVKYESEFSCIVINQDASRLFIETSNIQGTWDEYDKTGTRSSEV